MGAAEWARRLGITDAGSMAAFVTAFNQLDDSIKELPPPLKDGNRCPYCRKKIMLDSRFKELCNGLCTGGQAKDKQTKNGSTKILEIWRAIGVDVATTSRPAEAVSDGKSAVVGLSRIGSTLSAASDEAESKPRCRSLNCQREAKPSGFCSRRCEAGEADRVVKVARMLLAEAAPEKAPPKPAPAAPAPRKAKPPSLGSLMKDLSKPAAPKPPPAPSPVEAAEAAEAEDLEALRKFVVGVVGDKWWPTFVDNEVDDLDTLRSMTAKDLQDMSIPLGPRLKLVKEIDKLRLS
mmetsp:Transcript_15639/g.48476  ORF Transcript_15639/g.48476 Transcript_15639/m.48476 type:complete len:291 (-) Transcript_15639:39-911(-)